MQKIVVAIPCYNEAPTIGKVVSDFRNNLPQGKIVVFDNSSTDGSGEIARNAGADVVRVDARGKGRVIQRMFQEVDADIMVMVDGDDTYPADEIKKLIEPITAGDADMVVGDRLSSTYFSENKRPFHNNGNSLICRMVNSIFGSNLRDVLSGYRAFGKRFIRNAAFLSNGFEIETEITAYALNNGYDIVEVPVTYRDRPAGSVSKLNTFSDGWRIVKTLTALFRDYRPMAFFSLIAIVLGITAVAFLIPVFAEYFRTGLVARFPTLIFGCFLLTASLLSFSVGTILQVISNQNRRLLNKNNFR